jgi:simple sugar transport system substrate-binding protein
VQTAEDRGKWAVGQSSDMAKFGPHAQLTAIVDHWDDYYVQRTKDLLAGTWKPIDTWGGLNTGMVQLAPYNSAIPADVVALAEDARKAIAAGTLKPFQGPITDQSGKLIVPDGKTLADPDILSMNYYVQGVQGTLPK